ncbi:hypothetical protein ERJ75_001084300 [Trypanosoma vivax]|nr:hypothetical protein ERJ75_001084300 [Trypanosoma vivax]
MEAGLKRLVEVIELSKTHRTRGGIHRLAVAADGVEHWSCSVEDAILRRIWDLILRIVRLRVSVNFQFVFSHCGVPRNEAADKAAEQGNAKPQSYPAWITDIVTGVERQCGTRCTGPLRRVGCHARIAVRFSITSGQHQSTPR